jgi:hypothetical protein
VSISAPTLATTSGALPPIDPALEPASVRNGNQQAKNAYATGLAFEDVLVNELAQEMENTVPGLDGSSDGLGGTSDDSSDDSSSSGGVLGGGAGLGAYSSLLPQTLSTAVMSGGGTGVALQIAQAIDPALMGASQPSTKQTGAN